MTETGRSRAKAAVRRALGGRPLLWLGIRGEDGEALLDLPELRASFAVTAPLRGGFGPDSNVAFEEITGARPDLDRPDLDLDQGEAAAQFRARLFPHASRESVVMHYRPSPLVSTLSYAFSSTVTLAGMARELQAPFEYKPWVERSLSRCRGVRGLGWRYIPDEHRALVKDLVLERPQILRVSTASGGEGIVLASHPDDVDAHWAPQPEGFLGVAPYLSGALPVNFSGCVFPDGAVRFHPPSLQLIGIAPCTARPFGYCGNDFGGVSDFEPEVLAQMDALGSAVAGWLSEHGYRGAFGVDALVRDGNVYFTEVNPRFQGSSAQSAEVARTLDAPDLFIDHLAASLGLPPIGSGLTLADWAQQQPAVAHVVVHNTAAEGVRQAEPLPSPPSGMTLTQLPGPLRIDPSGVLFRVTVSGRATHTGFDLDEAVDQYVADARRCFRRE